jgi:aarF domain-containing kinase
MCRLWHAVAMRNPGNVRAASEAMGVPRSLQWVLPQLMARQTSQVLGNTPRAVATAAATARVDGLIRGGRPPMTMDQISEFGRALPREMMVVMRANALIRNIVRKLAVDVAAHEGRAGRDGDGRGILGLSLGGFVGGDVGRRMERRRQWAMAKYSCLGLILPDALRDGGEKGGGLAGVTWRQRARWRARTAKVWARMWTFRSMQYGVMLAIRTLPPGLSEPVVRRFTETLDRARGGLPAA